MLKIYSIISLLLLGSISAFDEKLIECKFEKSLDYKILDELDIYDLNKSNLTATARITSQKQLDFVNKHAKCQVAIDDFVKFSKELDAQGSAQSRGVTAQADAFFNAFQSHATFASTLQKWASESGGWATYTSSIGKSVEGRDIFAFKITDPSVSASKKKSIWINGGLHARERIAPTAVAYFIRTFLDNKADPEVANILKTFEFYFTPMANPDGYEYARVTNPNWRKNRRRNSDGSYGVDLNRNWDEHWGVVGASKTPSSDTYCGPSPNSEPEVQALSRYALSLPNPYGGIDYHSYGQYVLRNWGWSYTQSKNEAILKQLGDSISAAIATKGYRYTSQTSADLYPASGALDDWMAAKAKLVSYTIELCPTGSPGFQLPANQIIKCSDAAYAGFLQYGKFLSQNLSIPPNPPLP